MKIATKPATFSVNDMYAYYVEKLVEENPHFVIKGLSREGKVTRFSEVFHYNDNEVKFVDRQIARKQEELIELIDNKNPNNLTEISDVEIAIKVFEVRRKELILRSKEVKKIIDYKTFKNILTVYNTKAGEKIIDGKKVNLLNGLGYLCGRRVERNFNKKSINWEETDKLRDKDGNLPIKNGKKVVVFYTNDDWCRVAWCKTSAIKNVSVYAFVPSGGQKGKGFRQTFSKAIERNPALALKFEYFPLNYTKKK